MLTSTRSPALPGGAVTTSEAAVELTRSTSAVWAPKVTVVGPPSALSRLTPSIVTIVPPEPEAGLRLLACGRTQG